MRYGDLILRRRWEEKAREDAGEDVSPSETRRRKDIELYLDIRRRAFEAGESLAKIFGDVERRAVRYRIAINTWERTRQKSVEGGALAEYEEAEQNRRLAHNVFMDELNLLSRQFKEAGHNNEWRREIGLEREDAGRWGLAVAQMIYRKFEEEHEHDIAGV